MGTFVKVAIFVFAIYLGVVFAIPWGKYYIFRTSFNNAVDSSVISNIPENIAKSAEELSIPVTEDDVIVEEYVDKLKFSVSYTASVPVPFMNNVEFTYKLEKFKNIEDE
jgi:hypothetical protein